jgi:putative addiction module component (TIGR02574 family)
MDLEAVLSEVQSWPAEERLRLIGEVWDRLTEEDHEPALPPELKALLDQRLAALETDPDDVLTWEQIKAHARRPR